MANADIKLSVASVEDIEKVLGAMEPSELRKVISRLADLTPGVVYTPKGFPDEYAPEGHSENPDRMRPEVMASMVLSSSLASTVVPGKYAEIEISNMKHGGIDIGTWLITAERMDPEEDASADDLDYFAADFKDGTTWKLPVKAVIADMEEHEKASGDDDKWPRPISRAMAFRWFLDNCDKIEGWTLVRSPMFDKPDFDLMNDARWYSPETET